MKQRKTVIAAALAAFILSTGCTNQNQSSVASSAPEDISATSAPTVESSLPAENTTSIQAQTDVPTESTETTPEITPESSKEDYINALLGEGEVKLDRKDEETGLYMKIVENEGHMNAYIELPDYDPKSLCAIMLTSIIDFTHNPGNENAATFLFFDHNGDPISTYSINNYTGEWKALAPMMWHNDEFEKAWDDMMNEITESQSDDSLVIYDDNDIKITYKSAEKDATGSIELNILMENNSSDTVIISPEDFYTNGYQTITGGTWKILPGKKANKSITIFSSELEENNIETIENVEFSIAISFENGPRIETDRITLNPVL